MPYRHPRASFAIRVLLSAEPTLTLVLATSKDTPVPPMMLLDNLCHTMCCTLATDTNLTTERKQFRWICSSLLKSVYKLSSCTPLLTWGYILDSSLRWNCPTGMHPLAGSSGLETRADFLLGLRLALSASSNSWLLWKGKKDHFK